MLLTQMVYHSIVEEEDSMTYVKSPKKSTPISYAARNTISIPPDQMSEVSCTTQFNNIGIALVLQWEQLLFPSQQITNLAEL